MTAPSPEIIAQVRAEYGPRVLLGFSRGKDSLAAWGGADRKGRSQLKGMEMAKDALSVDMADLSDSNGTRARYSMGGGTGTGNFGVAPIDCCKGASMGPPSAKMLSDGDRGAGMPVKHSKGMMPAQAAPDHGPHGPMDTGKKMPMGGMQKRSGDMTI
jgi:hypothetical protein